MKAMGTANIQQRTGPKGSILPWWSRFIVVGIFGLFLVAAFAYWKRGAILEWVGQRLGEVAPIAEWFQYAKEATLNSLGLATIAVAVWFVIVVALARWRPIWYAKDLASWLINLRLWLSAVGLLGLSFAVMAFLRPASGVLGGFTVEANAPLSGWVGEMIIGETFWIGVLRTVGVGMATIIVAAPKTSGVFLQRLGTGVLRRLLTCYVLLILGIRLLGSVLRRMGLLGKVNSSTRAFSEIDSSEVAEAQLELNITPTEISAEIGQPLPKVTDVEQQSPDSISQVNTSSPDLISSDEELDGRVTNTRSSYETGKVVPSSVKVNKYWSDMKATATTSPTAGPSDDFVRSTDIGDRRNAVSPDGEFHISDIETSRVEQLELSETRAAAVPLTDNMASKWKNPPRHVLHDADAKGISEEQMVDTAETIRTTLADYGVEVEVGQIRPGPTVTLYGLNPGWNRKYKQTTIEDEDGRTVLDESGRPVKERIEKKTRVKVDSILAREKDLALALKTPSIRIETPVLGKSLVGIEVPNPRPDLVTLRGSMDSEEFTSLRRKAPLPIALGKGSGGETVVADLSKMPHLLVAGATGSGKSVCLNSIVSGLIMEKSPSELRLLLIDPKRVELTPYNGIPHLLTPVVVDTSVVVRLLKGMIGEMLNRYMAFEERGVRNIDAFNKQVASRMPYLVVVVDELADLMMTSAFDIEHSLCRLAQLGRATGIHLVVATQRPSVDVVTGLIKANFPSRVSFGVTSQIDSRTILDSTGAEKLLGRGDMLYAPQDAFRPSRIQGAFLSDNEVGELVKFWTTASWPPVPELDLSAPTKDEKFGEHQNGGGAGDELFDKAVDMACRQRKLSTSLLQRRLRIGYPRAARLMDELEEKGIVGPSDGSKSREVIILTESD